MASSQSPVAEPIEGRPAKSPVAESSRNAFCRSHRRDADPVPLAQSVKWLRKAANKGHAEAKRMLETVLAKAKGVH